MKFTKKDKDASAQMLIAFSQVTFGIAWGSIFLPVDQYKPFVVALNLIVTIFFIIAVWLLNRK